MNGLLLDANLSPVTAEYLTSSFGLDVVALQTLGLGELNDDEVVRLARGERRVIVTFDLDFGEMFHRSELGLFGVIVLRLQDQTVESVNRVLGRFFAHEATGIDLHTSLVVLDQDRSRVARSPASGTSGI